MIPPASQAVGLALTIMKTARHHEWSPDALAASGLVVDDTQRSLLDEHCSELQLLRFSEDFRTHITVSECRGCDHFLLLPSGGQAPAACRLTLGCDGRYLPKAKPAKLIELEDSLDTPPTSTS